MEHIVIIGNGISGTTCARYMRKQDDQIRITIISAETKYFFSRTALMYVYMGHMKFEHIKPYEDFFWEKNRIDLVFNYVKQINTQKKELLLKDETTLKYDKLVLACGSKSNFFDWPGQELIGVQGLYSFQDLQNMENNTEDIQEAVVIGGGLIGIELCEMLLSRGIRVTCLVREKRYWGNILAEREARMIEQHMNKHNVNLKLETELAEIKGDNGRVKSVITKAGEEIPCQFVGIATGVSPNISFLSNSNIETDKGILVDEYLQTNIKDVYAIGDCAQFRKPPNGRKPIEQVWYTGRMQGQILSQTLCGKKTKYTPGPWFNSAKFFDIEYQNYGAIPADSEEGCEMFYWQHDNNNIALRAYFEISTGKLIGINSFGLRLRHEMFDIWLREEKTIDYVLAHLADANFDPEFYRKHELAILTTYNKQYNKNVGLKKRSWKRILQTRKRLQHARN